MYHFQRLVNSFEKNKGSESPRQPPSSPYHEAREHERRVRLNSIAVRLDIVAFVLYSRPEEIDAAMALHSEVRAKRDEANAEAAKGLVNFDRDSNGRFMMQRYQRAKYTVWFFSECTPILMKRIMSNN